MAAPIAESPAELAALQISSGDFLARGVKAGDLLDLTSPSNATFEVTVESVTNTRLTFTPAVAYEAGAWTYQVRSVRYQAFSDLQDDISTYNGTTYAGDNIEDLDTVVSQLIRGARYTATLQAAISDYRTALSDLRDELDSYVVPREAVIDGIVQTMREQGLDRALDLLLSVDIVEFFDMQPDEVSYATNFVRKAATAGREVVPVSKLPRSQQVVQEWRTVSFQPDPFDPLNDREETPDF